MKFSYSKRRLYTNLIYGIIWIGIGTGNVFSDEKIAWKIYGFLLLGLVYLALFLFEYTQKYFVLTSDKIIINALPKKEINLSELAELKYYAGDYTFKSKDKSLKIVKSQIDKKQLSQFEIVFSNMQQELNKNLV